VFLCVFFSFLLLFLTNRNEEKKSVDNVKTKKNGNISLKDTIFLLVVTLGRPSDLSAQFSLENLLKKRRDMT
jgi:hypothetical protein